MARLLEITRNSFLSLYLRLKVTVILTLPSPLPLLGFDFSKMAPYINEMLVHCTDCTNLIIIKTESEFFERTKFQLVHIYGIFRQPMRRAGNLTTCICCVSRNSGKLNPQLPSGPIQGCIQIALRILST